MNYFKYLVLSTFLLIGIAGCSASEKTVSDDQKGPQEEYTISEEENSYLSDYRSRLSDTYANRENVIPQNFQRIRTQQQERDLYEGYRVQIYSGEEVSRADMVAAKFRQWADSTFTGYQPETYVFFRTPYYRVHVGDFHDRDRALALSNMIKKIYEDAWVVYDRVTPEKVPADSIRISTQ
ncbi:SPOR domain-containing protein [Gracilimonas mengyeensis]|uniref:Sporulation related domain-containing protein n=1 Tax=Gracilimonas mengyeensis TaxID=1302730 RepID=A0A521D4X4_9BACT|nr:SPOR domain-containing protein [Gracilimonas mengyeensis]SMO66763.1 Sporulation related domain-containing protein [Gracilimonas mengyeensis]